MAALTIRHGLVSGDPLNETPRDQWPLLMEMRRIFCKRNLPGDCRLLLRFVEDGRSGGYAGYADEDSYIRDGLGLDPEAVRWAVEGLSLSGAEVPVPFADAVQLGKRGAPKGNQNAKKDRDENKGSGATFVQGGIGRGSAYLAARLRRDSPEIFARLERGEFKSVRAAAKAAGIVREPSPLEVMQRAWSKASLTERATFDAWRSAQ